MKKNKIYILVAICIVVVTIFCSYLLFNNGFTNKILANVANSINTVEYDDGGKSNYNNYPIIDIVYNSSGEKLVNKDVVLTINASSRYNITNVKYSFDLKEWFDIDKDFNDKNISVKLVFNDTINKDVYIKVVNEKGYESYAYKTKVKIDKEKPRLKVNKTFNGLKITATDNIEVSKLQYSVDKMLWVDEIYSGEEISIVKNNFDYKYIRAVDIVGNISEIKEVN